MNRIGFFKRLALLFVRAHVKWDHEAKWVTKYKKFGGVIYILESEPMAYGDQRNYQIDQMESWF